MARSYAAPPESVSSAVAARGEMAGHPHGHRLSDGRPGRDGHAGTPGIIREIAFESGAVVAKGDLLVKLDTSTEEAQLRALEAQAELARLTLARERTLRSQNMVLAIRARDGRGDAETDPGHGRCHPGHHPEEDHPRAVCRAPGHPSRQPGPVSGHRQTDRLAPVADADICRFLAAAAGAGAAQDRHARARHDRYVSGAAV
jgi:pyruvate/2-oxoglutarate dehydrogenase complex dihydrolipoamide acyltransferase (E2) component